MFCHILRHFLSVFVLVSFLFVCLFFINLVFIKLHVLFRVVEKLTSLVSFRLHVPQRTQILMYCLLVLRLVQIAESDFFNVHKCTKI